MIDLKDLCNLLWYACVELDPEKVVNRSFFSEVTIKNTVMSCKEYRHVQFGNSTSLGKDCNCNCTFMASL